MEQMDTNWLQAIRPRKGKPGENAIKGAFQYNGGHGLTTFFVEVELADSLKEQLTAQGLASADTVTFCQKTDGSWEAAFSDEDMQTWVKYVLAASEMEALMNREGIRLVHV